MPKLYKWTSDWGRTTLRSASNFRSPFKILIRYCLSKDMAGNPQKKMGRKKKKPEEESIYPPGGTWELGRTRLHEDAKRFHHESPGVPGKSYGRARQGN